MNSRYATFLLALTTIFPTIIFSNAPAKAHSFDVCIDVQQEIAAEILNGTSRRQLRKKFKEFKKYEEGCDSELAANNLITLQQLRKGAKKKNAKDIANLVLKGKSAERDLDQAVVQQEQEAASARDAQAIQARQQVCAQVNEDEAFACSPAADSNNDGIDDDDEAP